MKPEEAGEKERINSLHNEVAGRVPMSCQREFRKHVVVKEVRSVAKLMWIKV